MQAFGQQEQIWLGEAPVATGELMALLLAELRTAAQAAASGTPDRVAVAVPSGWGKVRREALVAAATAAGFDPAHCVLVDRPVAAGCLAASRLTGDKQRHLLVYDLGATSFTASLLRRTSTGRLVPLGQEAIRTDLGVGAFDLDLLAAMAARSPQVAALLDSQSPDTDEQYRIAGLHALAETVKRQLSTRSRVSTYVTLVQPGFTFEAERSAFDEAVRLTITATVATCEDLLDKYDLSLSTVDVLVLAGGGGNLPLVARELATARGRHVDVPVEPELLTARGAAEQAALEIRARNEQRRAALNQEASRPVPVTGSLPRKWTDPGMFGLGLALWLGWAASGGWFTLTHWHGPWAWATLGCGALMLGLFVVGYLIQIDAVVGVSVVACIGPGVVHLVTLIVCAWRAIFGHTHVGWARFVCTAVAVAVIIGLGSIAVTISFDLDAGADRRTWAAAQRRLGRAVVQTAAYGSKPVPEFVSQLLAEHPAARGFTPAKGPFDLAIVQGRTLLLGSTEPDTQPTVATVRSAIDNYLGKPASAPKSAPDIDARFAARQINVYCFLIGELSTASETYAQSTSAELQNDGAANQESGLPAISTTVAVVPGGDLKTRLARLLDRADREYYMPLLERAAEAAGLPG